MNNNCLEGLRCPNCGNYEPFWIAATMKGALLMTDDGIVEEEVVETYWEDDARCECVDCGHEATIKEFKDKPPLVKLAETANEGTSE